jgi:hypothetical protein
MANEEFVYNFDLLEEDPEVEEIQVMSKKYKKMGKLK